MTTGRCLCGGVAFELHGPLRPVSVCHCSICRRWNGHAGAYTGVALDGLKFTAQETLTWYASSTKARRGFCNRCGSSLFFEPAGGHGMGVCAGVLDAPTGLTTQRHIHTASKGDYYNITDGLPMKPEG